MTSKPLVEIRRDPQRGSVALYFGGVFIDELYDSRAKANLMALGDRLFAAYARAVEPLRAQLAMAREALVEVAVRWPAGTTDDTYSIAWQAVEAIDADPPGLWCRQEKYDELAAVLSDLLKERAK